MLQTLQAGTSGDSEEMKDKLNIGSGKDYRKGWLNLEVNSVFKHDLCIDIREARFKENRFIEIYAKDVIDHMSLVDARRVMQDIYRWLKPNGALTIHTPNLKFLALRASQGDEEALKWMYGSRGEGSTSYWSNTIRWCYSNQTLRSLLENAGFIVMSMETTCSNFGLLATATKR